MILVLAIVFALQCVSANITLDCDYANNGWGFSEFLYQYQCKPKVIQNGESRNVEGVSQNHQTGYSDQNVTALKFDDQQIEFIPRNINLFFANLEYLTFYHCPIKSFTKDDLKPFPKLKIFEVFGGKLTTLNGDVFKYSPKLRRIDFGYNQITKVGRGIFRHSPELSDADFRENVCIHDWAHYSTESVAILANELGTHC